MSVVPSRLPHSFLDFVPFAALPQVYLEKGCITAIQEDGPYSQTKMEWALQFYM